MAPAQFKIFPKASSDTQKVLFKGISCKSKLFYVYKEEYENTTNSFSSLFLISKIILIVSLALIIGCSFIKIQHFYQLILLDRLWLLELQMALAQKEVEFRFPPL